MQPGDDVLDTSANSCMEINSYTSLIYTWFMIMYIINKILVQEACLKFGPLDRFLFFLREEALIY